MSRKPDPKQRPCLRQSTKAMVAHIHEYTRVPVRDIRAVLHSQHDFFVKCFTLGKPVHLHRIGHFVINHWKGRTLNLKGSIGKVVVPDRRFLAFRSSHHFTTRILNQGRPKAVMVNKL